VQKGWVVENSKALKRMKFGKVSKRDWGMRFWDFEFEGEGLSLKRGWEQAEARISFDIEDMRTCDCQLP